MKTIKVRIPVTQLDVIFRGVEGTLLLPEIILDFERQLNNLKLVSEVRPVGIYPRFHLGGGYEVTSYGNSTFERRAPSPAHQREGVRVSPGQRKSDRVQETTGLQQGSSPRVSEEVRIAYIKKMIGHYESGLLIGREVLEAITATLEAPLARVKVALEKEEK